MSNLIPISEARAHLSRVVRDAADVRGPLLGL
jgi:hypothetical protein